MKAKSTNTSKTGTRGRGGDDDAAPLADELAPEQSFPRPSTGTVDDDDEPEDERADENEAPDRATSDRTEAPEEFELDDKNRRTRNP